MTRPSIRRPGGPPLPTSAPQKEIAIFARPTPPPLPELGKLAADGTLPGILRQLSGLGGCTHPIRMDGHRTEYDVDTTTGEIGRILQHLDSTTLPAGQLLVRCNNRRTTRCPACAEVYRRDTFKLITAGLRGGKGTPEHVATHPRVFATFTAPGFGPVHNRRTDGRPCRCGTRHDQEDEALGTPLDPDTYDYEAAVLWNAHAGPLWRRFSIYLRREVAKRSGLSQRRLRDHARVSFAKVAEYQKRGAVHFHAVIRIDGPTGGDTPPPVWATAHRPRRFRPFTATEARQFLDAARSDRLHALYALALRTGLRKGELLGLHWEDLDLANGTASIRRSLQRTRTGGLTHLPTKTLASERRIALPTDCIRSLKKHRQQQDKEREIAGSAWRDSGLVFTTPTGRPLDPANLTRRFRSFLSRAGLRRIRFHDLRHSTATLLLEQGVDLVVIKELLGHAHIGVTAGVYAHVRLRLQRQAIDALGHALGSQDNDPDDPPAAAVVR
ncbi:site-specific integrase [Streptomyces ossamyceticus]|nr:site-specific integrase [Streptomyces ossamyceticus]